jgi:hypothetical protein
VLDTAWVLASSATRQAVSSRLQGPDEQDFEVTLDRMPDIEALRQRLAENEIAIDTRQKQGRYAPGGATLIDTSFIMSLGETVVVGTSRMRGGNKALIVLLSAAMRGAKPRE